MKEENKQCIRCLRFERYYTKGVKRFNGTQCGYCPLRRSIVDIHDTCDKFLRKPVYCIKRTLRVELNDLLSQISSIRAVLEDDENADTQN